MSKYYQEASEGCCLTCIFKDTPSAKLGFQKPLTALCFAGFLIHADEIQAHVVFPSNYLVRLYHRLAGAAAITTIAV
jgi:hypothetical protein